MHGKELLNQSKFKKPDNQPSGTKITIKPLNS